MSGPMAMRNVVADWTADEKSRGETVDRVHPARYSGDSKPMRIIDELHIRVADMIQAAEDEAKILGVVKERVHAQDLASALVENVRQEADQRRPIPQVRQRLAGQLDTTLYHRAQRQALGGLLWAAFGTAVTVATYTAAEPGGIYVIMWGAVVFGVLDLFKGLIGMVSYGANGEYRE